MRPRLRRHERVRALTAIACWALLLGQAMALWHAVAHGHMGAPLPVAAHAALPDRGGLDGLDGLDGPVAHAGHPDAQAVVHGDPWAHAAGDAGCRLVDQLLVGLAVSPPPAAAGVEGCPLGRFPVASPAAVRGTGTAFLARAPPRA